MPKSKVVAYTHDKGTGCFTWNGAFAREQPVLSEHGVQRSARLHQWETLYGPLPGRRRLHSLCGERRCVSPFHHVITSWEPYCRQTGRSQTEYRAMLECLEQLAQVHRERICHVRGDWYIEPAFVHEVATTVGTVTDVVHLAHGNLCIKHLDDIIKNDSRTLVRIESQAAAQRIRSFMDGPGRLGTTPWLPPLPEEP